jgi:hypothetical protein
MNAQVQFAPLPLTASIEAFIHDNNNNPVSVVEVTLPWSVHVELSVNAGGIFDGFCHFDLWATQIGGTRTGKVGSVVLPFPGDGVFVTHVPVIANNPLFVPGDIAIGDPPHANTDSGIYHIALVMTHHNQPGGVGPATESTAIVDFGVIRAS